MNLINPLLEQQPYEQGRDRVVSSHELQEYYRQQELQDLQRRSTRRSIWSIKSFGSRSAKSTSTGLLSPTQEHAPTQISSEKNILSLTDENVVMPSLKRKHGEWNRTAPFYYKPQYDIHNPIGPRWYTNHHLKRKGISRKAIPPLSAFGTQSLPHESTPSPQRTPVVTPHSSNVSLPQRRRKISLTMPQDNIDMLDGTDPWGQTYHHDSPYDVGLENKEVNGRGVRVLGPSPLSQSTSAINLPTGSSVAVPTRKLSKRRTAPPSKSLFSTLEKDKQRPDLNSFRVLRRKSIDGATDLEASNQDIPQRGRRYSLLGRLAKRFSLAKKQPEPQMSRMGTMERTSIEQDVRDPSPSPSAIARAAELGRASLTPLLPTIVGSPNSTLNGKDPPRAQLLDEMMSTRSPVKRVPPPSVDYDDAVSESQRTSAVRTDRADAGSTAPAMSITCSVSASPEAKSKEGERPDDTTSSVSIPYDPSFGKLMIANPDPTTPVQSTVHLPPFQPFPGPPEIRSQTNGTEKEYIIPVPVQNGLLVRPPLDGIGSLPPVERPFLSPLNPVSPLRISGVLFNDSTPRASMHVGAIQARIGVAENPLPPTPAASSITFPTATDSQPSPAMLTVDAPISDVSVTPKASPARVSIRLKDTMLPEPQPRTLRENESEQGPSVRAAEVQYRNQDQRRSERDDRRPREEESRRSRRDEGYTRGEEYRKSRDEGYIRGEEYRKSRDEGRSGYRNELNRNERDHDRDRRRKEEERRRSPPRESHTDDQRSSSARESHRERERRSSPVRDAHRVGRRSSPSRDFRHDDRRAIPSRESRDTRRASPPREPRDTRRSSPVKESHRKPPSAAETVQQYSSKHLQEEGHRSSSDHRLGRDSDERRRREDDRREERSSRRERGSGANGSDRVRGSDDRERERDRRKDKDRLRTEERYRLVRSESKDGSKDIMRVTSGGQEWEVRESSNRKSYRRSPSPEKDRNRHSVSVRQSGNDFKKDKSATFEAGPSRSEDPGKRSSPSKQTLPQPTPVQEASEALSRASTMTVPPSLPPKSPIRTNLTPVVAAEVPRPSSQSSLQTIVPVENITGSKTTYTIPAPLPNLQSPPPDPPRLEEKRNILTKLPPSKAVTQNNERKTVTQTSVSVPKPLSSSTNKLVKSTSRRGPPPTAHPQQTVESSVVPPPLNLNKDQPPRPPPTPAPPSISRSSQSHPSSSSKSQVPPSSSSHLGSQDRLPPPPPPASGMTRPQQSSSTRPTSDLPPEANYSSLRAREAWEVERLKKGKSSASIGGEYDGQQGKSSGSREPNQSTDWMHVWSQPTRTPVSAYPVAMSISRAGDQNSVSSYPDPNANGSTRTSYSVQAPFIAHGQGRQVYAPYQPPLSPIPTFSDELDQSRKANPLPEPPKESQYTSRRGQPSQQARGPNVTTEYWKNYSGVAAQS